MIEMDEDLINGGSVIYALNFVRCFFRDILNLSLSKIKSLGFVESQIDYKKIYCSDYSLTEPIRISKDDEPKFRFLKKYFAEQGNHFKEQDYFSYEMMAREKYLRHKIFSVSEIRKDFLDWLKILFEFLLFYLYKLTSNFGMSWLRPLICLFISALAMCFYIEVQTESYFGFFNNFFVVSVDSISLGDAILKTISPISTAEEFKNSLGVKLHCLFNAALIFLFGLGIRNKFKIK